MQRTIQVGGEVRPLRRVWEYTRPDGRLRLFWWLAGRMLGTGTAIFGRTSLLRGDVVFERKAVRDYGEIIGRGIFAGEEACLLARFIEDEKRHVANWQGLLERGARTQG